MELLIERVFSFQAKKLWAHRDAELLEQTRRMEQIAPNGSAVFNYSGGGYRAAPGHRVVAADARPGPAGAVAIGDFLADSFLPCEVGTRGMHYDAVRRILTIPTTAALLQELRTVLAHRLRIEIVQLPTS